MKLYCGNKICDVYRLRNAENIHVAIPERYAETIGKMAKEFGSIENIPTDKTIPGVFLNMGEGYFEHEDEEESDILIKRIILP